MNDDRRAGERADFLPSGAGEFEERAFERAGGERSSILIVDDLPEKLLVFGAVLEDLHQELVFVRSGVEALREILKREFAVILLDVNMPDIDGFETASLIRRYKKSAHTPIIFITSYADDEQTRRGYALGAVDFILSPVVPEVLRTKVKVFVELHTMQQRVRRQGDERGARMAAEAAMRVAEDNTRRSHFLSHASRMLGTSLDVASSERDLLDLLLPRSASLALLLRTEGEAGPQRALLGSIGPGEGDVAQMAMLPTGGLGAALQEALAATLDSGLRLTLDEAALAGFNAAAFGLPGAAVLRSAVLVPLASARRKLGVLLVACEQTDASSGPRDWTILEELASRAAVAFENAELYRSLQSENAERTAAEAKLQEASRRKDEFLAMLAHELRNPLAPIRNALELIRRLAPPDVKLGWARDVMERQVKHMTRLVDELLDVARISEGKITLTREPVDLKAVIEHSVETAQPLIDEHRHVLQVKLPDSPVWLQGDFARLSQVVGNLLHNAAKYSGDGGRIALTLTVANGEALITVRDHGIGIEAALLPHVFDLFAQGARSLDRSQGGLGIGLTLVRRLVELHGGQVQAASEGSDRGTEFRVRIPAISVVQCPPGPGTGAALLARTSRRRVLIVDDNRDAAESIAQFLELEGHEVKSVGDGMLALASVPVFMPQVVLLDIGLPGLSGYEVAKRLRGMPSMQDTLLVAVTGYGQREDRQLAADAGFDHHFVKPTDPRQLAELIGNWASDQTQARPGGATTSRRLGPL